MSFFWWLQFQKNKAGDIEVIMDAVKFEAPDIGSDHDHVRPKMDMCYVGPCVQI